MKKWALILLLSIFAVFAFLRFYNLDQRIIFGWDQEQFSFQIKNLIQKGDLFLLGPRANNDRGFFLGPYFTYLLVPFYLVTNFHPIALLLLLVVYNLAFFGLAYYLLKKMFGLIPTLIFLVLWSTNHLLVSYDTIPWWPLLVPLAVIFVWNILFDIYKKPDSKKYILLGATLGFFLNIHIQFLFMILFVAIFILLDRKKLFDFKKIILASVSFVAMFTPLFIFDLTHNFQNTIWLIEFFMIRTGNPIDQNVWLTVFGNFIKPMTFFTHDNLAALAIVVLSILFYSLYIKGKGFYEKFYLATVLLWFANVFGFSKVFAQRPSEYYFTYLYPFIFIAMGVFFTQMKNWKVAVPLIALFVGINIPFLAPQLVRNPIGLQAKEKTVLLLKENLDPNKKINVSYDFPLGLNYGYSYLIEYYGINPTGNPKDTLVELRDPPKEGDFTVDGAIGVKIPPEVRK